MVDNEFEIGHFEPCTSLTGPATYTNGSFTDTYWNNCDGPYETSSEDPKFQSYDSPCYPFGDTRRDDRSQPRDRLRRLLRRDRRPRLRRHVLLRRLADFDLGRPVPGAFAQAQPTSLGRTYPQIQFETDNAATQFVDNCDLNTGANCVLPPPGPGPTPYPYWTLSRDQHLGCVWEFGNVRDGNTFGEDAQYGPITFNPPGAFTSPIERNPRCSSGR